MKDCLFCSIANGDPSKLVWQNADAAAFKDLYPDAPVHILVVPKRHIARLSELDDEKLAGKLLMAVREVARQEGIGDHFQLAVNNGEQAGQVVHHLHFHVMGNPGKYMAPARRHLMD